jgi:predicted NUDIX family NTP pyrophosphohydrolase
VPEAITPPWRGTVFRRPAGTLGGVVHKRSAGILLFRRAPGPDGELQVLLGHMGGPFWARRDAGAWSVIKGEYEPDEMPEAAARREFQEELGLPVPGGELLPLGEARQAGGKVVTVWALAGDLDPSLAVPGTFTMEWPRGSGRIQEFPEIDRAAWLDLGQAREKIIPAQRVFLDRLADQQDRGGERPAPAAD